MFEGKVFSYAAVPSRGLHIITAELGEIICGPNELLDAKRLGSLQNFKET